MWNRVLTVALNTYRECVRARILFGLGALALGTALYSIAIGAFTLGNAPRVVADIGAASISLYAIIVAVVIGGTTVYRELELKTVFPILARPIRRDEYVVGKYLGILLTLAVFIAFDASAVLLIVATMAGRPPALTIGFTAVVATLVGVAPFVWPRRATSITALAGVLSLAVAVALAGKAPDEQRVVAGMALLSLCEVGIVAAVATVFSSFSSPFLSAVLTAGIFLVGRSADTLAKLPARTFGEAIKKTGEVLSHVVPNLQVYVPPRPLLTGEADGVSLLPYLGTSALQSLAWVIGLLALSCLIFRQRDFL